ncbi:MAG: LON peptidase substrate-binding domain-containing protein [Deltaproteobacteria bacterium]|nr:LON peptidase substrate-binding domain-containing protein [Deltaproteobacteria bacterium]
MTQTSLQTTEQLEPGAVLAELPVFPLPNSVFFPGTLLPLHIFEPRYRAMVSHAMEADQRIAIALLKPGFETDYYGAPEVHDVVCIGEIIMFSALPDGRSNLVLRGVGRGRVLEELETPHDFRVMRAKVQGAELVGGEGDTLTRQLATVRQLFSTVVARVPQLQAQESDKIFSPDADPGHVLDAIASTAPAEPVRKQEMLSELNLVKRAELLISVLAEAVADSLTEAHGQV